MIFFLPTPSEERNHQSFPAKVTPVSKDHALIKQISMKWCKGCKHTTQLFNTSCSFNCILAFCPGPAKEVKQLPSTELFLYNKITCNVTKLCLWQLWTFFKSFQLCYPTITIQKRPYKTIESREYLILNLSKDIKEKGNAKWLNIMYQKWKGKHFVSLHLHL